MSTIYRPLPFSIPKLTGTHFQLQVDCQRQFYHRLHFHPEIQITLLLKGQGTLICGEYMGEFFPGDIFLIGSNVGHVFKNTPTEEKAHSITLFIDPLFLNSGVFNAEEKSMLRDLSQDGLGGVRIKSPVKELLFPLIADLPNLKGLIMTGQVFHLLHFLTRSGAYEKLSLVHLEGENRISEDMRMNELIQFILENSQREIGLDEAASLAALTKSSFCRYFKQRTGKTYTEYVSEVRINHACQLLRDPNLSVSEVCFESGYSNISHFNRKFRRIKGLTPSTYRRELKSTQRA